MTILAGILMLGILVFVHELGHFCVAKLSGVKVLKFSIGFGPRLLSKQFGETEYMVCAIPLGGYVQMLGEGQQENGEQVQLSPEEQARSFAGKPVSRRIAIVAAGPLMNLIFPFVVLPLAYMVGVSLPAYLEQQPCIGYVVEDSVAARAGFEPDDCIVRIGDREVLSWEASDLALVAGSGKEVSVLVRRDGAQVGLDIPEDHAGIEGGQALGLLPIQEARVGSLVEGMPGAEAGLKVGDLILSINDEAVQSWYDLRRMIQIQGEGQQSFVVDRAGEALSLNILPKRSGQGEDLLVGIAPVREMVFKRFGLFAAMEAGFERSRELISLTVLFIQKIFLGEVSSKSIGGPITVMQIAGQAAQTDLASVLTILAFLSIQLGILNLLPIPVLDGGHLFFYLCEIVFRRPLSMRAREAAQKVGLFMLLGLMALAFYNDIFRLISGGMF